MDKELYAAIMKDMRKLQEQAEHRIKTVENPGPNVGYCTGRLIGIRNAIDIIKKYGGEDK